MVFKSISIGVNQASGARDDAIVLPKRLAHLAGLTKGDQVTLGIGAIRKKVPYHTDANGQSILIGKNIASTLALSLPARLKVLIDADESLIRIGPIVAIFACTRANAKGPKSRALFGARTLDMRQLLRHARRIGMCAFVLTPEGVNPAEPYVSGYVISRRRWKIEKFPIPDVIYDRVQARDWERRENTQRAKGFLQSIPHLKYFNDGFFDKWELHQRMEGHPSISKYLPDTEELIDSASFRRFLDRHRSIFIKPTEGSLGRGVTRIRKRRGGYEWKRGGRTRSVQRFDTLYTRVNRLKGSNQYIMQPDLRLATFQGAPFDVRILMQKDGRGVWMRTKTYARVAARGRITANISRGGTGVGLGAVLRTRFGRSRRRMRANIARAARSITKGLDDVFEGQLGEIGLDLGISVRGRIWLIEVNSKPFRKVLDAGPKVAAFRSFRRPMAYANFLAGY